MVNINNANNQGISANYYKDFNVDNQNLILNNHKGQAVNTQLGGVVYGNPNFNNPNGREADIILNEITTNRVSNINGYIEVAGKRADVIIANPNGIMVGGAGFINTNRLSMITGKSLDGTTNSSFNSNGELNPFLLTDTNKNPNAIIQVVGRNITDNQGNIVAYNLGIDAQDVRYADLISRVVKINGNIHGNTIQTEDKPFATEVNIKTGNDRAYYNTDENGNKNNKGFNVKSTVNCELSTVNCEAEAASHKPEFAIDSTAFGGIYAGRINFIATENGVGVRTRSDLIASTDDLNFDVNGNIILEEEGSLYAKKDINLNNKTKAENKNNNTSPNDKATTENQNNTITNKSTIAAENNINITADELINANTNQNSKIYALNDINIASSLIDNSSNGHINAGNDLNIDNNDYLNNQSGQILSGNNLTIKSDNIDNSNNGYIFANSNMDLINLNNSHGIVEGNGNITIANTAETSKNNEEFQKLNNEHGLILSTNSSNNNSKIIINTTNDLANTNGSIKSNGDIEINVLTDYIISGMLYSNSDININAKNIKNYSDVISGNNITFTANGNIYNGNESTNATIIAMNDIIFNILKDSSDTTKGGGSLFNYGVISANNNIEINAENSIYNGLAMGSNARISSNNNLTITAENRIINKGYIQTTGSNKDSKLILETRTGINDDYELRNNGLSLDEINNKVNGNKNEALPPELQAKLDNLNNITDVNELYEIIPQLKTEEQYYLVQNRIKILSIKETLSNLNDAYTFNEDDWANKSNEEINEQLQEIFGNNYDEELNNSINNTYNNYLAQKETEIDDQIQQQLNRKQQAEENNQEFNETLLNKDELMAQAEIEANAKKLEKIKKELNSEKLKVSTYLADLDNNNNWASLTNEQINEKLQDILNNNYVAQEWSIPEYQALDSITPITNEYLGSLRINSIDTNKTEQTGIHNYGRIYSNTDMELNSNSVLHNNKGALIYSNNDIAFNINKVLFNNENNMGQGIYANNNITIQGYDTNPYTQKKASLEKLINYDGRIEANNNIDIKSNEVINYGSDSIDLSKVDTEIKPIYDYYYTKGLGFRKKKIYISKEEYERRLASGDTTIGKTFKWYGVEETPELLQSYGTNYNFIQNAGLYQTVLKAYDTAYSKVTSNESTIQSNSGNVNIRANNTTNYNSVIFANNDLTIDTKNLLNKNLEFNVNANQYYQYHGKKKKWTGHAKEYYDEWTSHIVLNVKGDKTSKILAGGNLLIAANSIGNGMLEANSNYSSDKKLPYTENNNTNSPLDIIKKQEP